MFGVDFRTVYPWQIQSSPCKVFGEKKGPMGFKRNCSRARPIVKFYMHIFQLIEKYKLLIGILAFTCMKLK